MIDLSKVSELKVLLIGDAIMDEYVYVRPIGKAVKESALSAIIGNREVFKGGVWAAAKNVENFCAQVDVMRGDKIMWNSRLVDDIYFRKLFVTHDLRENDEQSKHYDIRSYDLVIVCDFGHGTMTKALIEQVSKEARFLAVNAQTSSTNYGFNLITKYHRADFVVVDDIEARLAAHDKDSPIEDVILALGYRNIIVTQGAHGAVGFDGAFERQKALTDKIVDSMGAGDAFLTVTAPFASIGLPMRDLVRIGNAAGAIKVGILGHRKAVDRETLDGYLNG